MGNVHGRILPNYNRTLTNPQWTIQLEVVPINSLVLNRTLSQLIRKYTAVVVTLVGTMSIQSENRWRILYQKLYPLLFSGGLLL